MQQFIEKYREQITGVLGINNVEPSSGNRRRPKPGRASGAPAMSCSKIRSLTRSTTSRGNFRRA